MRHDCRATSVAPAPLLMALEPRVVYDGSAAAVGAVAAHHHADPMANRFALPGEVASHHVDDQASHADAAGRQNSHKDVRPATPASTSNTEVVFVDPTVTNYQALIANLPAGARTVVLNPGQDGLAQIANYLEQHPGVRTVDLVSHGSAGQLQAGSTVLETADLGRYSSELQRIGAAMQPGGSLLLYGCDVAQGADGQMLVQGIASLTHLNVAASTDPTGAADRGGDWTLEYRVGAPEASTRLTATTEQRYDALLGQVVETYDSQIGFVTAGGAAGVTSFTLDGFVYTTDQAVEFAVDSTTVNQGGTPPLTTGPTDGVLFGNVQGTQLTSMTMTLQNGDNMAVRSFDVDTFGGAVSVQALDGSGNVVGAVAINGSVSHLDLSNNAAFADVKSLKLVETDGFFLSPTLNNFTYVDLNSPPSLTASGGTTSFVEGGDVATTPSTPVAVDSGITLTDGDSSTAVSATASITGGFQSGQDVLGFTNTSAATYGDISASYVAGTGVLTLTSGSGTATIAQWQAALRAVTYTDTSATPSTATRTISFNLNDGLGGGNTVTKAVSITTTDQIPHVTTTGGTTSYFGGASAVTVDGGVSVSDLDNTAQSSATVSVTGGFHSGDTLAFSNDGATMGNITGSYNAATGVLTLTSSAATATNAQWAHALDAVTFSSTSATYGDRTVAFVINDGTSDSAAATKTVDVKDPSPVLTTDSGSAAFVAGDNTTSIPVVVDSGLTVTDPATSVLQSATVSITGNFQAGEDRLAFTNTSSTTYGDIAGSYNASTGVLTLTSSGDSATLAQWRSALDAVTYTDTAITPNTATRTVSFTVTDGAGNTSATATRTVTVIDTDQTPIVSTTGGTTNYVGGASAATIDAGISVSDLDNTTQVSGTVSVSGGFHSGDTLSFTNDGSTMGNIAASYNAATGVLTLTSAGATATDAQWSSALSAVSFSSTSTTYGDRTIAFATSDGTKTSAAATDTVHMTAPPKLTTDSGSAAFVAGDNTTSTPVAIDSGLTVTDGSATTLASATVAITGGFHSGEDVLAFTNDGATMGDITASYNAATGVMTLTSSGATATLAQWQSALQSVTYTDTAVTPNAATRTISFTAVDGAGDTSATATRTVTVIDTDQTPIVTTTGGTTSYVGGASAATIDGGISVSDLDNTTQVSGTVSVTGGFHSGDTLSFTNDGSTMGNIVGSYNAATGVLTLTSSGATATDAQWAHALSAVTFSASSSATPGARTISFATSDGTKTSAAASDTVTVSGPPVLTADSGSAAFVAGDNTASIPVAIDSGLTLSDGSSSTLQSATVVITGNFHSGEDVLAFVNTSSTTYGDVSGAYNSATGVLTLTSSGGASLAQWQAALQAVTYTDTAITPNNATRTVSFTVLDGAGDTSATATRTVTVTDTDQTPIVATTGGMTSYVGGASATTVDAGVGVGDLDNTTQSSATVSVTSGFHAGDTLAFTNDGSTMGDITGSYNAATGVLTLTSAGATATDAQWANALSAVTFSSTSTTYGGRTVSFIVNDGTENSVAATKTVDVGNPDPVVTTDSGSAAFVAGDNMASTPVAIDSGLTVTDPATGGLQSATIAITGGFHAGEDVLAFANDGSTMGDIAVQSYDAATGVLTLTSSGGASLAQWQAALQSVTYTDTAITPNATTRAISFSVVDANANGSATATRTVTVADTDQTPIVATTGGVTSYVGGTSPVVIDNGVAISDLDNSTQASATVSITSGVRSGDTLAFANTSSALYGDITASYNAGTGVLTLTSSGATATDAQWAHALEAVTFSSTSTTYSDRTVSFVVNDGTDTSAAATRTIDVTNPAPVLATDPGSAAFVAGDNSTSTPVVVDSGVTLADPATGVLQSAAVAITSGFHAGEDVLAFANTSRTAYGDVAGAYDAATGVLTLTSSGGASLAQWQAALRAVTYTDTAITPNSAMRTISFNVVDARGDASATATRTVTVADTDQTPVVATGAGSTAFIAGDNAASAPVTIAPGITIGDRDNGTLASARVSISGDFAAGQDILAFTNDGATMGDIAGAYDASTGVLTLTSAGGSATTAQWRSALASVTYTDTAITPDSATRTISFSVSDGAKSSVAATRTVTVADTDQTPTVATSTGEASYTAGDPSIVIDSGVTLSDRDGATFASGTVSISAGLQNGDVLAFAGAAGAGNITGSYDPSTGVLTLTSAGATATQAQWQAAFDAVTFASSAQSPAGTRTIAFAVSDGTKTSADATRTLDVAVGGGVIVPPEQAAPVTAVPTEPPAARTQTTQTPPTIVLTELDRASTLGATPAPHTFIVTPPIEAPPPPPPSEVTVFTPPPVVDHVQLPQDRTFSVALAAPPTVDSRDAEAPAPSVVSVRLADGAPLPPWAHYDPTTGKLTGSAPQGMSGVLRVVVTERDSSGHVRLHVVEINLGARPSSSDAAPAQHVAPSAGKPSLAAQFEQERRNLHVSHRRTHPVRRTRAHS